MKYLILLLFGITTVLGQTDTDYRNWGLNGNVNTIYQNDISHTDYSEKYKSKKTYYSFNKQGIITEEGNWEWKKSNEKYIRVKTSSGRYHYPKPKTKADSIYNNNNKIVEYTERYTEGAYPNQIHLRKEYEYDTNNSLIKITEYFSQIDTTDLGFEQLNYEGIVDPEYTLYELNKEYVNFYNNQGWINKLYDNYPGYHPEIHFYDYYDNNKLKTYKKYSLYHREEPKDENIVITPNHRMEEFKQYSYIYDYRDNWVYKRVVNSLWSRNDELRKRHIEYYDDIDRALYTNYIKQLRTTKQLNNKQLSNGAETIIYPGTKEKRLVLALKRKGLNLADLTLINPSYFENSDDLDNSFPIEFTVLKNESTLYIALFSKLMNHGDEEFYKSDYFKLYTVN